MQIHELNNYAGDLDSNAYVAVDDGNDTGKISVPSLTSELKTELNEATGELNARIDNIIAGGDAPSEAEVTDARLGANGVTYGSLGTAIRSQVENLQNDINFMVAVEDIISSSLSWEAGAIGGNGLNEPTLGFFRTGYYPVKNSSRFVPIVVGSNAVFIFEYASDFTFIQTDLNYGGKRYTDNIIHQLQDNTAFIRLCTRANPRDTSATISIVNNISVTVFNSIPKEIDDTLNESGVYDEFALIADYTDLKFEGAIHAETGDVIAAATTWVHSDYIDISKYSSFYAIMPTFTSLNAGGLAFYKSDKTYLSGIKGRVTGVAGTETMLITVPAGAVYMRTGSRRTETSSFKVWKNAVSELGNIRTRTFDMQMFEKIGVISDSISVGWALDKNGVASRRNTGISWVQQLARRLGCTAYNLGASGVDPIEWFQNDYEFYEYCLPQYQSVGACDLYIIGLGLNGGTLGSVSDINQADYTQNGATFYGQYARIIQMINAEHPNAIVMCLTEPTAAISSYDQAVRDICALNYINAELVDLENDYFDLFNTVDILAQHQPDGLHFTPLGYSLIAEATMKALNDYISKNPDVFKYVGVATV